MLKDSYIHLRRLRFHAYHGVEAQERLTGNDYEVNLRLRVDVSHAMVSDNVDDTVNYASVYDLVAYEMGIPARLVEHVAYRIGRQIMSRWTSVQEVEIQLIKRNPPMGADCEGAGVELHLINNKTES